MGRYALGELQGEFRKEFRQYRRKIRRTWNLEEMHTSVLLNEVLEYLDPQPGKNFIDATLNGGGHATAIAERIAPTGKLIGIEWDIKLAEQAAKTFAEGPYRDVVTVVNDSYVNIAD